MKRTYLNLLIIIFSSTFFTQYCYASNNNLLEAYENIKTNNFQKSAELFIEAAKNPEDAEEAFAMLLFIENYQDDQEECFKYLTEILKVTKNKDEILKGCENTKALFGYSYNDNDEFANFFENLIQDPYLSEETKVYISDFITRRYYYFKDYKKLEKENERIGGIKYWSILGSFENISGSGFDKDFGALTHPDSGHVFLNKESAEIKWFRVESSIENHWIHFPNYFDVRNTIHYAQTYCYSPMDTIAQIRAGTSGSLKLWVNDLLYASIPEERNNGVDTYIFSLKLNKGYNRILVQVGCSEIKSSNFFVRITDVSGNLINGLEYTPWFQPYIREISFSPKMYESATELFFMNRIKQYPTKLYNYLLLSGIYLLNDKNYEARLLLSEALKIAPNSNLILYQLREAYNRSNNRTNYSHVTEMILKNDPDGIFALTNKFHEATENKNFDEAHNYLEKIEKSNINKENYYILNIDLLIKEKKYDALIKEVQNAYKEFPMNYDFTIFYSKIENNINNEIERYKNYLSKYNNYPIKKELINVLSKKSDIAGLIELYENNIEDDPTNIVGTIYLGDLYFEANDYDEALKYYLIANSKAPFLSHLHGKIANTYKALNKINESQNEYKIALKYNPCSYDLREKLRSLELKKPVFDIFPEFDYYEIYKKSPDADSFPGYNAIVLKNDIYDVFYEKGANETKYNYLIKPFTREGVNTLKEYTIGYYGNQELIIEKAEVLKKDGSRLKAEIDNNKIVFTKLSEGDAILLIYKLQSYQYQTLNDYIFRKNLFAFYVPVQSIGYYLLAEKGLKFYDKVTNSNLLPKIQDVGDYKMYSWEMTNLKPIMSEVGSAELEDYCDMLSISTFKDWSRISKWYYNIANSKAKSDIETKDVIEELFPKNEILTKIEKAKRIYSYIIKNIRYSYVPFRQSGIVPQKASAVLNTLLGDCKDLTTLFVALCREVDIDATWVLVSTRDNGKKSLVLPSIDFNHCIALVKIDDKKYYVEMTDNNSPFGCISGSIKDAFALEINDSDKSEPFYINSEYAIPNSVIRNSKIEFQGDKMTETVSTDKTGYAASSCRDTYLNITKEQQDQSILKTIIDLYSDAKLKSLKFVAGLDNVMADSVSYVYTFETDRALNRLAGLITFTIPLVDYFSAQDFFSTEQRQSPLDLYIYCQTNIKKETVIIDIPDTLELVELPSDISYSSPLASYSLSFVSENKSCKISRTFTWKKDYFLPEEYSELKSLMDLIIKADKTQIAFKNKAVVPQLKGKKRQL